MVSLSKAHHMLSRFIEVIIFFKYSGKLAILHNSRAIFFSHINPVVLSQEIIILGILLSLQKKREGHSHISLTE